MRVLTLALSSFGLAVLLLGGLVGCEGAGDINISGPTDGSTQNVAVGGPGVQTVKSPCAGNVNTASGPAAKGDGNNPSGGSSATGANNPDCSKVEQVPPPVPQQ